jgi:hypothetical protein
MAASRTSGDSATARVAGRAIGALVVVWALATCWVSAQAGQPQVGVKPAARPSAIGNTPYRTPSLFAHSGDCQACHNGLVTPAGEDVSIGTAWRATMMANSSRDPYWQAAVRRETLDHPSHAADIQDECAGCHMPMSTRISRASGRKGTLFDHLPLGAPDAPELGRFAADGVSCTVCHQIAPDGLGTRDSFNARFTVTAPAADGIRRIFGPFEVDSGRQTIMRSVTGYEQVEGPHIQESELCASCHTLITSAFGPDGQVVGSLPEQMNYQEWRHSDFRRERSCQSCHMPRTPGPIHAASVLGDERDSLARHTFVGGNAHMLRLLNRFRDELGVTALPSELEAAAAATVRQLQHETATLSLTTPQREAGRLVFDVGVTTLAGHKFPTGYPARRTWLHVVVTDDRGTTLFESGAVSEAGMIDGNAADTDGGIYEPHYDEITRPDQVQVYETVLGDRQGAPTTGLLTATQYLKDNRLLPRGFDKVTADAEIAVYGSAREDASFQGGGDRVRYAVPLPDGRRVRVAVELRYQAIGYRWATNLMQYDAPEPKRFASYYRATAPGSTVVVATASTLVAAGQR